MGKPKKTATKKKPVRSAPQMTDEQRRDIAETVYQAWDLLESLEGRHDDNAGYPMAEVIAAKDVLSELMGRFPVDEDPIESDEEEGGSDG